jgi:hypothetical protein
MRVRSPLCFVLVAFAVLAAFGHVCVLPIHSDGVDERLAQHATPTSESHGDNASCEAVSGGPSYDTPTPIPVMVAATVPAMPAPVSLLLATHPVLSRSSPLFLVHRALRI